MNDEMLEVVSGMCQLTTKTMNMNTSVKNMSLKKLAAEYY